ncbi:wax ester/triacylglycerol synthase domain-containing protein [Mycobacterium sp. B14F4]|uniref:wax ester/triacylglycerol synthase domain-containing protein n=1 Tax=Mycobacterium sp. B14F4 TaxID=3153565 RepID=UPI00325DB2EE
MLVVDRLSVADATALHTQTPTTPAHTVVVLVLEASDQLSHQRLQQFVASSLSHLARLRSRLVGKPMGVGQPVWVEIDGYDASRQIHTATVATPGGSGELADLVTKLVDGVADWRRSPWEAWSIDGLAAGRWAVVVKMSPVLCEDGHGVAALWQRLVTSEKHPERTSPPEHGPGPAPSLVALVTDTVTETIENQITGVWMVAEAATTALLTMRRRLSNADESPVAPSPIRGAVPKLAFNAPLTRRRSTAFASIRLADVTTIGDAFGGSTANVVLAACTLALRSWLLRYDAAPPDPLLLVVPLSLPAGDAAHPGRPSNTAHIEAPVHLDDPVQVLSELHTVTERLAFANRYGNEITAPPVDFATVISLLPPWMTRRATQMSSGLGLTRLRAPNRHGAVSFTGQPSGRAYCAGSEVLGMYVIEPLVEGCGLNIGVTTHGDAMDVCISVCPDNVPDVEQISSGIGDAVAVLLAAAAQSPRGQGRSVVTEMTSHISKRS